MIKQSVFFDNLLTSALLIGSLLLSLVWFRHFGTGEDFTHPFVYLESGEFGELSYPKHKFFTFFSEIVAVLVYCIAQRITPRMYAGRFGDLWIYHYVFLGAKIIDFVMTYRTSDFRVDATYLFLIIQACYMIWLGFRTDWTED